MPEQKTAGPSATRSPDDVVFPEVTPFVARIFRWFGAVAIATWLGSGLWPALAILDGRLSGAPAALFVLMFAVYGAAILVMLTLPRRAMQVPQRVPLTLASLQTVTGIGMNTTAAAYLGGTGLGLVLLVIVAAELPYFLSQRQTWTWIALQTILLTASVSLPGSTPGIDLATFAIAAIGFQAFAAASSILALNEGRARTSLARVNAELTATRELLAESTRTAERLRISRDLHDTLGHHLAALSLQLDVASRLSQGKAVEHINRAHAIARLLLSDVRDVVDRLREQSPLNLADAIRALTAQPAGARVHLDLPDTVAVNDTERSDAILRMVQEALTNTARHSHASNLWIRLTLSHECVTLDVRDDGCGVEAVVPGNGLRGMQERFAQQGGRVEIRTAAGEGFGLHAFLPRSPIS